MFDFDKSKWQLDPSDFEDANEGTAENIYFKVAFCVQKSTGHKYLRKKTINTLNSFETKIRFDVNVYILATNKHPAIVPFIGYYEKNDYGYLILENYEKGNLNDVLHSATKFKNPVLTETEKLIISYGISCVMEFLHNKMIIHRDLKCSNVLLDSNFYPILAGFSSSTKIDLSNEIQDPIDGSTPFTMAPEFIEDPDSYSITLPIDVYSYGILIYHLITGLAPYSNLTSVFRLFSTVSRGEKPPIPENVPDNWIMLIKKCYSQDPSERPNFTDICDELESEKYVNDRIDRKLFEKYQKIVKPFRPSSRSSQECDNLSKKVEEQARIIEDLTSRIKTLENTQTAAFDPFKELESDIGADENYFTDDDDAKFYKTVKIIGEGGTSIVYKMIDTRTNQVVCKKVLKRTNENSNFKNAQNAMKEFEVLRMILHPCICKAYKINIMEPLNIKIGDEEECTTISIFLEFLPRSLKECIAGKVLDNTLKVRIAVEVAHALNFIHKLGMIHRDVKIENIMLNSAFEAKVVDFGLFQIKEFINNESFVTTSMTKGVGTLSYMSPEMINEEEYDKSTDVYSYGIMLYYLLLGEMPQYNMKDKINGKQIPFPESSSSSITEYGMNLITECTNHDPSKRPSFEVILKEMREKSFQLAPEVDKSIISKRDREISFFESTHKQINE